jgi:hypothetical protein
MANQFETSAPDVTTITTASTPAVAPARSRRAILAAALAGLGGAFASRFAAPDTAVGAAGDPLIIGNTTNNAGTANTTLTTASAGTALLVTQNGSGTALRGSAVGAGSIAGFFTAANGTGISGVTANASTYGVFGSNNGGAGSGGAVRADGNNNDGIVATTDNAARVGVKAATSAAEGTAVLGTGGGGSGGIGVRGDATNGVGLRGISTAGVGALGSSGSSHGVRGTSNTGQGVRGESTSATGVAGYGAEYQGVYGDSNNGSGVVGASTNGVGVYGYSVNSSAGFFEGLLSAYSVNAAIKNFRIDHPLDPANKVLEHSCVESNERLTVYAGTVTTDSRGEAVIKLPGYFDALNRDVRYQLTALADARAWVKRKVAGGSFTIATSEPGTEVCWQVTGVRQDAYANAHPLNVEAAKTGQEKGRYLHPAEHGKPDSQGVAFVLRGSPREGRAA